MADTQPPLHGFRGAPADKSAAARPRGLTVAVSREAGARGAEVAAAAGRLLGWPVYDAEMLDFLARDEAARADHLADVPPAARRWADAELDRLVDDRGLVPDSDPVAVARLVFDLAAKGEAVLVGRAAGFVLPPASTVHVRVIAPFEQRAAVTADRLRLTTAEAEAEVRARDRKGAEFLAALTDRDPVDPTAYDLCLNSDRLGVDGCADLIAQAVRAKQLPADPPPSDELS